MMQVKVRYSTHHMPIRAESHETTSLYEAVGKALNVEPERITMHVNRLPLTCD